MHESEERGKLILNGKKMETDALAQIIGLDKQILTTTLTTLLTRGVASIDPKTGALFNRRMVSDEKLRKIRQNAGKMGGNPVLLNQNPTTHLNQKSTPSSSSSASADTHIEPPSGFPKSEQEAVDRGGQVGADADTCRIFYAAAIGRGYTDSRGQIIRSWPHYVKSQSLINGERKEREKHASTSRTNSQRRTDGNVGTTNDGKASQYRGVGKVV